MLVLALTLAGCVPQFNTVDDACVDDPNGTDKVTPNGAKGINRINCHRRVSGVRKAPFRKGICEATLGHANYLSTNWDTLELPTSQQETIYPAFTGRSLKERLLKKGIEIEEDEKLYEFVLEFPDSETLTPQEAIDAVFFDPYVREILLQPSVTSICYERDQHIGVIDVVYVWPPDSHNNKPVLYPDDGQYEVPTTGIDWGWTINDVAPNGIADPAKPHIPVGEPTGFPITLTVTSDEGLTGTSTHDAYGITAPLSLLKEKGGGLVEATTLVPALTLGGLVSTVVVVPHMPLEPRTEYTLTVNLLWGGGDGEERLDKEVEMVFNTLDTTDVSHPEDFPFVYAYGPLVE